MEDSEVELRSLEDIGTVFELAKLENNDYKTDVQSVYFSTELDHEAIKLLELDSCVLESLTQGDDVVIRGDKDEGAVLCTKNKTYEIKEAEISNSMLIAPDLTMGKDLRLEGERSVAYRQVTSVVHGYFELRPCKPKVKKLKDLLEVNKYSGRECEMDENHQGKKFKWEDLLDSIQASESEIKVALEKLQACKIEGYWRVLDFDFLSQVLNHIIQLCEEQDWLSTGVPLEDCCQTLEDLFPRGVIEHVLRHYGDKMKSSAQNEDDDDRMEIDTTFYNLNEDKICRFFAELVLRNSEKFNFQEFLTVWEQSVPTGMKTSLFQLEGLALIERNCKPEVIWYFPVENLPEDISERFNFLFKTRDKWTLDEITPYIRDLTTDKLDVGALLTRYARASLRNGTKVFNSRRPVT